MGRLQQLVAAVTLALVPFVSSTVAAVTAGQEIAPTRRAFTVVARDGQFTPSRIEVARNDLVIITLKSDEQPYSFAIDAYRVMKRAGAGQTITFEFRADQVGSFEYYCSLSSNPQCRAMKGTLTVTAR